MGITTKRGYWFPAGNDEVALFPGQNELLFMKKLDTDMDTALTANIASGRIPNLPASKITSGTFAEARIPTIKKEKLDSLVWAQVSEMIQNQGGPRVTGPRNINSLIATEIYDSGNCFIERHNNIVVMYLSNLKLVGSGSARLVNLPYGFKPNISPVNAFVSDKETRFGYLDIYDSGSVWMGRFGDGIYHISTVSWVTDDDWPSTLPGDPA